MIQVSKICLLINVEIGFFSGLTGSGYSCIDSFWRASVDARLRVIQGNGEGAIFEQMALTPSVGELLPIFKGLALGARRVRFRSQARPANLAGS
jgi:hypothetical protein